METITGRFFFFFVLSSFGDNSKTDLDTKAIPNHSRQQGCDNLKNAIKVRLSIAQIKMESVTHFNPHLHTKEKKKHCVNSINFRGIYNFGQRTNKVVHFPKKLDHEKRKTTIKTEEQSLTPQLWRKSSHAGSWVSVVRRR